MANPKISVVVPVYNVEEYLEDTLNCLLNQSFIDNMEIIMIDDGSNDSSRYIIEKYALDYDNFYAYHKNNEGLSITRNFGIELAKGEYIQFLDGDDLITLDGYEKLYGMASRNSSDIVTSGMFRLTRYNYFKSFFLKKTFSSFTKDLDSTKLEDTPELMRDTFSTNKLFRLEFLKDNELKFPQENILYEDLIFTLKAYALAETISVSSEPFYYWRIRKNEKNLSITQKKNIRNFTDRITIINRCIDFIEKHGLNDDVKEVQYLKWLNHDIYLNLSAFNQFNEEHYQMLIDELNKILDFIPENTLNKLNSFKKIIYKMVRNNDIEGLVYMSSLDEELKVNPHIPSNLDEKYLECINFENDAKFEELIAKKQQTTFDCDNVYIKFSEEINYLPSDYPHETHASLIDNNDEYPLEINDNNQIVIPIDLIKNNHSTVKMEYVCNNFTKESYLRNPNREVFQLEDFDIEIGIKTDRLFTIDKRLTNDLKIEIDEIILDDDFLKFKGKSSDKINEAYIENVVTFEKIKYPIYIDDELNISFSVPYKDILKSPVKKWEVRLTDTFKSIRIVKKFEFNAQHHKIYITNARNKILIGDDFYDIYEQLDDYYNRIYELNLDKKELNRIVKDLKKDNKTLEKENKKLKKKNKSLENKNIKLKKQNDNLQKIIEEYKSRFVVKSTDYVKKMIK